MKSCYNLNNALYLLGCIAISSIACLSYANAQNKPDIVDKQLYPREIGGEIKPSTDPASAIPPRQTRAVAQAKNNVSTFNQTVVQNSFTFDVFDASSPDGDQVRIIVNGRVIRDAILLTSTKQNISVDLREGVNTIEIAALNEGSASPNTLGIEYPARQVLQKTLLGDARNLTIGTSFVTTVGFPQIALCRTIFRFPCTTQTYPETALHVLEAQGIPPEPIRAPLRVAAGNPLRLFYPRLLTIDRTKREARGKISTRPYRCPNPRRQDRDEYPPALFEENSFSAHIKCIPLSDNRGAGNSIGTQQVNKYKVSPTSPPVKLDNQDVIELVILR